MTQKVNQGVKKVFRNLKAFSLVELIIVIAIVAILSVAGFLTLQKRISQSRDSKRLGDLETIEKSLTVNYIDQDTAEIYSMPDENNDGSSVTTGTIDGETVAYKGTFGSGAIENVDNLNEVPVDPLDDNRYAYGVTEDQQYFQIAAVLENGEKVSYKLMDRAYAADKKSTVRGNYDGLMVYTKGGSNYISNIPSLIFNNTGSLTNTGVVSYVVDGSSNLAYGEDTTQKESFEEVVRKKYSLSGEANVSFVNTGTDSLKQAIEEDNLREKMKNSLGGNEGVIEAKLEESGVSVDSSSGVRNLSGTRNDKYEHDGFNVLAFTGIGKYHELKVNSCVGDCKIDILIVGGGGSGGERIGGGGGAGGLVFVPDYSVSSGKYDISVGAGGPSAESDEDGISGENSEFGSIVAVGGGGGGGYNNNSGLDGGSGGGGAYNNGIGGSSIQNNGYGNSGGQGSDDTNNTSGGGGGGAGESGQNGDGLNGGDGGNGLHEVSINGEIYNFASMFGIKYGEIVNDEAWFAGGGGAGVNDTSTGYPGDGGLGGGGDGNLRGDKPEDGLTNTGGGGGSSRDHSKGSGSGGSGIVLIRYPKN